LIVKLSPKGNYIISLGQLCRWLGEQAEGMGVEIYAGADPEMEDRGRPSKFYKRKNAEEISRTCFSSQCEITKHGFHSKSIAFAHSAE
jgi:hypothetical protein